MNARKMSTQVQPHGEISINELFSISAHQLLVGSTSPANIYIQLTNGKILLIIREGHKVNLNQLHTTSDHKVDQLFVHRDSFAKLFSLNLQIAGVAVSHKELSDSQKMNVLVSTADGVFREIENMGFNTLSCSHAKFIIKSLITLIESKDSLRKLISSMQFINEDWIKHSMSVSGLSVILAESLGWSAPQRLEKIALGGFLHDIGLREIPEEIVFKPRHQMTLDEVKTYEEHVTRGAEILRSIPDLPDDIISIALQHHENYFGTGYPFRIRDTRINPSAKVIAIIDAFADLVFSSKTNSVPRTAEAALTFLETSMGQPFNKQIFSKLKDCVNGELPRVGKVKVI